VKLRKFSDDFFFPFLFTHFLALSVSGYLAEASTALSVAISLLVASLYALSNLLLNWSLMRKFSSVNSNADGGIILAMP